MRVSTAIHRAARMVERFAVERERCNIGSIGYRQLTSDINALATLANAMSRATWGRCGPRIPVPPGKESDCNHPGLTEKRLKRAVLAECPDCGHRQVIPDEVGA